jgi:glucokinase
MFASVDQPRTVIGVDLGGTKCAAGLVSLPSGELSAVRRFATEPARGGEAVLHSVLEVIGALQIEATQRHDRVAGVGIGLAELVDLSGKIQSAATIDWQSLDPSAERRILDHCGLASRIEADVRAAARAEASYGNGRGLHDFLYVSVGTGISASLVVAGEPYGGARGLTGTFASEATCVPAADGRLLTGIALERFASGPAMAQRMQASDLAFHGSAVELLALAAADDPRAVRIVESAGRALGAALAQLVNLLDPAAIVIGGGLGLTRGLYRASVETALRRHIWSDLHRDVPLLNAALGPDAGVLGAALAYEQRSFAS